MMLSRRLVFWVLFCTVFCGWRGRARGQEFSRPLLLGIGVSAGAQYDSRSCKVAGHDSDFPGTSTCMLFAGGVDVALLWHGWIGGMAGLYSASGQAAVAQAIAGQAVVPGIPDRVSVPLALDVRPLALLIGPRTGGYRARLLEGVGLRIGPSVEVVRTATDSAVGAGLYLALQGEVPLHGAPRHGVSLRFLFHTLVAPQVTLNGGMVCTGNFSACTQMPPPSTQDHGYAPVFQTYLGLVYYP